MVRSGSTPTGGASRLNTGPLAPGSSVRSRSKNAASAMTREPTPPPARRSRRADQSRRPARPVAGARPPPQRTRRCPFRSMSSRSTRRRCRWPTWPASDRNAYDRYYFNAHGRTGDPFFVTGLGVYPNLGVIDAFATVRTGRPAGDACGRPTRSTDDRLTTAVGPYRVEVVEPLQTLRLVCDADDHGRRLRPDLARLVPGDRRGAARLPAQRARSCSTPSASPRSAPGRACSASRATELAVDAGHAGSAPATARGASVPSASAEPPGRGAARSRSRASGGATCRCASTTSR